jgi:muramoyltetrapeptide carboxypeptidase LdcA involved in peptidoglycan recycling
MKKFGFATIAAGALTTAFLGLAAPSQAAPTGPNNAQDTISQLESRGVRVIINRQGLAPLDQASVTNVRFDRDDNVAYVSVR